MTGNKVNTSQGSSIVVWVKSMSRFKKTISLKALIAEERLKHQRLVELREKMALPIYPFQVVEYSEELSLRRRLEIPMYHGYAIRAVPKSSEDDSLGIVRKQDLNIEECEAFIKALPDNPRNYQITVNSYFRPKYSGTIIATRNGVIVEFVEGKHFSLNQQFLDMSRIYTATLRAPCNHFTYNTNSRVLRGIMWSSVRFLLRKKATLSPLSLMEDITYGYFEVVYHPEFGFRFIDARQSDFWTDLGMEIFKPGHP